MSLATEVSAVQSVIGAGLTAQLDMRPIEPSDKPLLQDFLERSSRESVYRRFLGPHGPFSDRELRHLTEVDHRDH